jgi:hypothetical protein
VLREANVLPEADSMLFLPLALMLAGLLVVLALDYFSRRGRPSGA